MKVSVLKHKFHPYIHTNNFLLFAGFQLKHWAQQIRALLSCLIQKMVSPVQMKSLNVITNNMTESSGCEFTFVGVVILSLQPLPLSVFYSLKSAVNLWFPSCYESNNASCIHLILILLSSSNWLSDCSLACTEPKCLKRVSAPSDREP